MSRAADVVIVGAPRSGTNMLRDVLTALPGFTTWDCDEINLTWRHGNRDHPDDELDPGLATGAVSTYIRSQFDRVRRPGDVAVVEKTCANSLRVGFVQRVKPEARYVFITRDGLDVTPSTLDRWHTPLDLRYTAAKARYVPASDVPHYALRFARNLWRRRVERGGGTRQSWWGPKPHDWAELLATRPLDEVALIQWQRCVDAADRDLASMPSDQVHRISYEQFVTAPTDGLRGLLAFLGAEDQYDETAVGRVKASSVGRGRATLDEETASRLSALGMTTLRRLGYEPR